MNEQDTATRDERFGRVLDRFARLTPGGMQHFIGRLISDAPEKPALKNEIENALQRMETDFHLRKCWHEDGGSDGGNDPCDTTDAPVLP